MVRSPQFSRDPGSRELAPRKRAGREPRLQVGAGRFLGPPVFWVLGPVLVTRQLGRPANMALSREPWAGWSSRRGKGVQCEEQVNNSGIRWELWDLLHCLVHFK